MDVIAGRKGSPGVAAAFTVGLGVTNMIGLETLDTMPNQMNFVVAGELTFYMPSGNQFTCGDGDMRIGQGNSGGVSNNWWLASADCSIVPLSH